MALFPPVRREDVGKTPMGQFVPLYFCTCEEYNLFISLQTKPRKISLVDLKDSPNFPKKTGGCLKRTVNTCRRIQILEQYGARSTDKGFSSPQRPQKHGNSRKKAGTIPDVIERYRM